MVQVGLIGIGFMGMIHYLAYQKVARRQGRRYLHARPNGNWRATGEAFKATSARRER